MEENRLIYFFRFFEMILGVVVTSLGLSFMFKSGLGQTSVTAFTQNISFVTGIKSGTLIILFNMSCVLIQILILKQEFQKIQFLQLIVAWLQGQVVNMICYQIPFFSELVIHDYWVQWVWMLVGIGFASYGVAMLMNANLVKHPFEELCMILSKKLNVEFSTLRVRSDILFMLLSVMIIFLFKLDFSTLREGTWVCMILLGKSMRVTFKIANKLSIVNFMELHHKEMILEK